MLGNRVSKGNAQVALSSIVHTCNDIRRHMEDIHDKLLCTSQSIRLFSSASIANGTREPAAYMAASASNAMKYFAIVSVLF